MRGPFSTLDFKIPMNLQKLSQLNENNRAAQLYFATFAARRRSFSQTTVQDVVDLARRQNHALAPSEVEAFFDELEAADCGQFVRDEGGSRFLWLLKANQVARAARQKSPEMVSSTTESVAAPRVLHQWRGRADWTLTLELPPDFSVDEARRLCHFVLALPLEETLAPHEETMES